MPTRYNQEYIADSERPSGPLDYAGRQQFNTVFGENIIGWRVDNISVQFQYGNSTRDVTPTTSGSGSVTNSDEMAVASVGSGVGNALIRSVDPIRYRPGHEMTSQFTSIYSGMQVGVNHYHGLINDQDGVGFGTKDGIFGIWFIQGGIETFTPQSDWRGDKCLNQDSNDFVLDPTKMNIYQVQYGWLGVAPIVFSIYTGFMTGWRVVHWIDRTNSNNTPHLNNPSLPVTMRVVRTSGTGTTADIRSSSWRGGVVAGEDESNSSNRWNSFTRLDHPFVDGVRNNVFTIQNKSTYLGKINHVVIELGVVAFTNTTNKTIAVYGTKGATLTGNSAYVDVSTQNSVVSISTGGSVTGGTRGPATVVQSSTGTRIDVLRTGIIIYPGETFTFDVEAGAGANGTVSISARWIEYF